MSEMKTGQCIYCGQARTIEAEGIITEEDLNHKATELCDCEEAKAAQKSQKVQTEAEKNVEKLFREEYPDTAALLKAAVIPIMSGAIDQIAININGKIKGKATITAKGNVKIERTETQKTSLEE